MAATRVIDNLDELTTAITGLVKGSAGAPAPAVPNTDYVPPNGVGSALTVTPTGATTASTLATRFGVTLDAKADFGAAGDGTTNDTTAILAGVAAVKAAGGGCLRLPRGTYVIRRPIVLASYVTLEGLGRISKITRPTSTITALTANAAPGTTVFAVASTAGLAVGYAVAIWDDQCDDTTTPTLGIITAINGLNVTVAADLGTGALAQYNTSRHARLGTAFPLIRNELDSQGVRVVGLTLDANKQAVDVSGAGGIGPDVLFCFSNVDWIRNFNCVIQGCTFLNSLCDGYSDQSMDYRDPAVALLTTVSATRNKLLDCTIDSPARHGIHLGTNMDGAILSRNTITNCGGHGIFYCAYVQNTIFAHNIVDTVATAGVGQLDSRDISNMIVNNQFANCGTGGVDVGNSQYTIVAGNKFRNCNRAVTMNGAQDIQILGNVATADTSPSHSPTISINSSSRIIVSNNELQGGAAGTRGLETNVASDLKIANNIFYQNAFAAIELYQVTRGQVTNNTISSPSTGIGISIFAPNTEVTIDGNQFTSATTPINWDTIPVRLILNGMGDNGSNNPASAGDWNALNGLGAAAKVAWNGIRVRWDDGAGNNYMSLFQNGTWLKFAAVP